MSGAARREIEIKLALADAVQGRRLLEAAGFSLLKARVFEDNVLYDTADHRLRDAGTLLRVRQVGDTALLTFKGPATFVKHKSREELEVQLSDAATAARLLERLGFAPVFRYQKYRTEYAEAGQPGVVTLDETPIGDFFELEGAPEWIDRAAARLGFREADYLMASYAALYFEWCQARGIAPAGMLFAARP